MLFGSAVLLCRRFTTVLALALAAGAAHAAAFGFDAVAQRAEQLAKKPYQPPKAVPPVLEKLTYDELRDIRFRPDRALWRK